MAELLETIGEALVAYWSSALSLMVLAVFGACMGTLLYVFVTNARNAKLRVSLLTGLYGLSIFFWAFLAASLLLCVSQAPMVAYARNGVPMAVSSAVIGGFAVSAIVSLMVWRYGNAAVLRKFAPRDLKPQETWLQDFANLLSDFEGVQSVRVRIADTSEHIAMTGGGKERTILVSRALIGILERDEMATVIAHELMHLKHHDAEFKVFSRVISRVLFFDPFSKFFDPAVHREREYLADEASGRTTGRPAALASALLKLADHSPPPPSAWGLSIVGPVTGLFSRYPPVRERVQRLLLLSDILGSLSTSGKASNGPAG